MFFNKASFDLISFLKGFYVLLNSGRPVTSSLEILIKAHQNEHQIDKMKSIQKDIEQGFSLTYSIKKNVILSAYVGHLLYIGEKTGQLTPCVKLIYEHLISYQNFKRKLIQAFSYPCILVLLTLVLFWGFLVLIIPEFYDFFYSLKKSFLIFQKPLFHYRII